MRTDGQVSRAGAHLIASDGSDVEALRAEIAKWQERVPKLVSVVRERTQEVQSLREQLHRANSMAACDADASIRSRDQMIAKLQQQIESLEEKHSAVCAELHTANLDLEEVRTDADSLKDRNANLAETTEFASQQIESLSREVSRLVEQNELQQKTLELQHEQREGELTGEVQRLNSCIEQAQHSHDQLERERRALAEKVATLEQALLEAQRSADSCKDCDQQLGDAEREARVNQKHALCTLEDELYLLKCELDEQPWSEADDAPSVASELDSDDMPARLLELEQLLRERTEQLDNLRWRAEQQHEPTPASENLAMILHQQLQDTREENRRLHEKLNRSRLRADLTVLKGVGVKVAEQLAGLGYGTLEAIARLETSDLDNEDHPLHSFKSRIARDDWIGHAKEALED